MTSICALLPPTIVSDVRVFSSDLTDSESSEESDVVVPWQANRRRNAAPTLSRGVSDPLSCERLAQGAELPSGIASLWVLTNQTSCLLSQPRRPPRWLLKPTRLLSFVLTHLPFVSSAQPALKCPCTATSQIGSNGTPFSFVSHCVYPVLVIQPALESHTAV